MPCMLYRTAAGCLVIILLNPDNLETPLWVFTCESVIHSYKIYQTTELLKGNKRPWIYERLLLFVPSAYDGAVSVPRLVQMGATGLIKSSAGSMYSEPLHPTVTVLRPSLAKKHLFIWVTVHGILLFYLHSVWISKMAAPNEVSIDDLSGVYVLVSAPRRRRGDSTCG